MITRKTIFFLTIAVISVAQLRGQELTSDEKAIDSLVSIAVANAPLLKAYDSDVQRAAEDVRQEKNKWLSTFRLGINFFSVATTLNESNQSTTTAGLLPNIGLNLGVDPEKFINRRSYIREAGLNLSRSRYQYDNQVQALRMEIAETYFRYIEAITIYHLREEANATQEASVVVLKEKYRKGEISINDFLLAESGLTLTREALAKAQIQKAKIYLQLKTQLGLNNQPENLKPSY